MGDAEPVGQDRLQPGALLLGLVQVVDVPQHHVAGEGGDVAGQAPQVDVVDLGHGRILGQDPLHLGGRDVTRGRFEPGIAPNYTFFKGSRTPLTVSVPITFGLGNEFYGGETFGYFSVGPQLSVPLDFVPEGFGKWTYSIGYKYYRLGDTTSAIAPNGDADQHLISTSISAKF